MSKMPQQEVEPFNRAWWQEALFGGQGREGTAEEGRRQLVVAITTW